MMKLVWIFAFLPLCFGSHEGGVTNETCMNVGSIDFTALVNGSTLNVCSQYLQGDLQCCSQSDENILGMTLNNAISAVPLGMELSLLQSSTMDLYSALSSVQSSLINDVLRPLMNDSVDRTNPIEPFDGLDMVRDEVLDNINSAFLGNMNVSIAEEMFRYFKEGISLFYVNFTFDRSGAGSSISIIPEDEECAINATYHYLFPPVEQAKIASLGNNLQQIAVAYEVARAAMSSTQTISTDLGNFNPTSTCTNVWTQQYACPLCAGQTTPLCEGRCNEVLIGCTSSLQQVIVQLNVLLDFTRASVNSLISGNPYANISVNNIGDLYNSTFETSLGTDTLPLVEIIDGDNFGDCGIQSKKRSVDYSLVRNKRQSNVMLPTVAVNQSLVTMIRDTLLPAVMNVSLASDRVRLCDNLMANGPDTNCTLGVGNISPYMSTFDSLEIADQENNPAGTFNLTQLREQAMPPLTYAVTNLLTNRSDIMMLYDIVLPERDIPNLDFLNEPAPTPTITATATATQTASQSPRPTDTGGATAVSFSLFITLVALLFTSVFVD